MTFIIKDHKIDLMKEKILLFITTLFITFIIISCENPFYPFIEPEDIEVEIEVEYDTAENS